ncbi:hypothetical protein Tco_1563873 [Tanacetum coccineum]
MKVTRGDGGWSSICGDEVEVMVVSWRDEGDGVVMMEVDSVVGVVGVGCGRRGEEEMWWWIGGRVMRRWWRWCRRKYGKLAERGGGLHYLLDKVVQAGTAPGPNNSNITMKTITNDDGRRRVRTLREAISPE